jgi:hypothetical protein
MTKNLDFYLSNRPSPAPISQPASKILPGKTDPTLALAIQEGVAFALRAAGLHRPPPVIPKGGVMTDAFIDKELVIVLKQDGDPSVGSPYTRKRPCGDYQSISPEGYMGYPLAKTQGRTQAIAEQRLRKKLKTLKRYDSDEKPTNKEESELEGIFRLHCSAPHKFSLLETYRIGLHINLTKIAEGLTNDISEDGIAEGRRKLTTMAMAKAWFFDEVIPDSRMPSERKEGNDQRQNLEPVIREIVALLKPETPVIDVVRNAAKFNKLS